LVKESLDVEEEGNEGEESLYGYSAEQDRVYKRRKLASELDDDAGEA
jgi:hypothetical protein